MRPADDSSGPVSGERARSEATQERPVRVRVSSPHPVIRAGIGALLAPHTTIVVLAHNPANTRTGTAVPTGARARPQVDVVLYDVFGLHLDGGESLEQELRRHPARVLALSRVLQPGLTARALDLGAVAAISIEAEAEEFVTVIRAAAAGHLQDGSAADLTNQRARRHHLGHDLHLTPREQQVLALLVAGASNSDIADRLYVSINTVKTLIRSAYKKIGVTTRSRAVAWGIEHGYPPEPRVQGTAH